MNVGESMKHTDIVKLAIIFNVPNVHTVFFNFEAFKLLTMYYTYFIIINY